MSNIKFKKNYLFRSKSYDQGIFYHRQTDKYTDGTKTNALEFHSEVIQIFQ